MCMRDSAHPDLYHRLAGIVRGREHPVRRIGIAKIGDIDHQGGAAFFARHALHGLEAVQQVSFGVAIHVLKQVVDVYKRQLLRELL